MPDEPVQVLNLSEVLGRLRKVMAALQDGSKLFNQIGNYVRRTIKERTVEQGVGPEGPWPPPLDKYSESYRQFRLEQDHFVDHVYHDYTGGMWGALTQEATKDMVRIFFYPRSARKVAVKAVESLKTGRKKKRRTIRPKVTEAEKALYLHRRRPFFLLSEEQIKFIVDRVGSVLAAAMGESAYGGRE